jgi:uncharacterized protein
MGTKHTNLLSKESSPYLLQHQHNPVNWRPWGEEAFRVAREENKPVLVSIGYSACHWCHVMEHECFEDEEVAVYMNAHFVNIKVDREERPDVDMIYMNAVQLMNQNGGWPLNCFTLPDGKPFYGGTYFPKQKWLWLLQKLVELYHEEPEKAREYADKLTQGVQQSELISLNENEPNFTSGIIHQTVENWSQRFDYDNGGPNYAPKFPLPNNYTFLIRQDFHEPDEKLNQYSQISLDKMHSGGIYDHLGGGFCRYSVDALWKVPHFEKMLYDNAQLISLYTGAWQKHKKLWYKHAAEQTIGFVLNELTSPGGAFYSALDADSEGEEGKYYTWRDNELFEVLGEDYKTAGKYFIFDKRAYWDEADKYVLIRRHDVPWDETYLRIIEKLKLARNTRKRPGLDDKTLCSWNAMMIKALAEAYVAFENPAYLEAAEKAMNHIFTEMTHVEGKLFHTWKAGEAKIEAFLDDYAFVIDACVALYQSTFNLFWIEKAKDLQELVFKYFSDEATGFFWYTPFNQKDIIARKHENSDNVIPASNSVMAHNLFKLGQILHEENYLNRSKIMLNNMIRFIPEYGSGYSNWAQLLQNYIYPFYTMVITGQQADSFRKKLAKHYLPNVIFVGGNDENLLPLLAGRTNPAKTTIFVCQNGACLLPVYSVKEALQQLRS